MFLDWCVLWYLTFMLKIWHGGEWLKRDLAQPFYGCVECGSPIPSLDFASLIWGYFSLYFYEYYTSLYVDYMPMISFVFLLLLCCLCICFMTVAMYGSHHVLLVNGWTLYLWSNGWNESECVEASMLLSDYQLSMRPLSLDLLFTPVGYICVICLMKSLSWLVWV